MGYKQSKRLNSFSANTIYSGSTDLSLLIGSGGGGGDITRVQGGTNISTGGTANEPVINLDDDISLNSVSGNIISATTLYSGSTNLSSVFAPFGSNTDDITRVQGGTNISTGGTANEPVINLDDDISLNSVSGNSISATTLYSGSTNLETYFNNKYDKTGGVISGDVSITGDLEVLGTATTLNTETVQTEDNNIELNYSGTHISAIGGGITLISGQTDGSASEILSDNDGYWQLNPGLNSPVVSGDTFYSAGTELSLLFAPIGIESGLSPFTDGTNTNAINTVSGTNTSSGSHSFVAGGNNNTASGNYSHAEGGSTLAFGNRSHAEGSGTKASGHSSHAEGNSTEAEGDHSHAEGIYTFAVGFASHAEGSGTQAPGIGSHAEGGNTDASGYYSHAEGYNTTASGEHSHSEGRQTTASGNRSHAEGYKTTASGLQSHAEGSGTTALGNASHAEGRISTALGDASHAEGRNTSATGTSAHAEGIDTQAFGFASHAEGRYSMATTSFSHAEGRSTLASGNSSHAEGRSTTAGGYASHAEGRETVATGNRSHAEGYRTTASNDESHAEGRDTVSSGAYSHAGGLRSEAQAESSFAHGQDNFAKTNYSVVMGVNSSATTNSGGVAIGWGNLASGFAATAFGMDTSATAGEAFAAGHENQSIGQRSFTMGDRNAAEGVTSAILGGNTNRLTSAAPRSVILGGSGITGSTADTVYTPNLDVQGNYLVEGNDLVLHSLISDTNYSIRRTIFANSKIYVSVLINSQASPSNLSNLLIIPAAAGGKDKFKLDNLTLTYKNVTSGNPSFHLGTLTFTNLLDDNTGNFDYTLQGYQEGHYNAIEDTFAVGTSPDDASAQMEYAPGLRLPDISGTAIRLDYAYNASATGTARTQYDLSMLIEGTLL